MKNLQLVLYALVLLILNPVESFAQSDTTVNNKNIFSRWVDAGKGLFRKKEKTVYTHPDLHELTLEENLLIPEVPSAAQKNLKAVLSQEVRRLYKIKHAQVTTPRKGEVIKVVLPMSQLFQPNDSLLWSRSENVLRPFVRYLSPSDYYHVLLVAHSDDTGSDNYTLKLSQARSRAVAAWLKQEGGDEALIVPYGVGSHEPLFPNTSEVNRDRNRRLEIYLVPAEVLVTQAKKGKITYK